MDIFRKKIGLSTNIRQYSIDISAFVKVTAENMFRTHERIHHFVTGNEYYNFNYYLGLSD